MQLNQLNFFARTERSQISEEDPSLIPALFRLWSKSNVRDRKIVSQEKTSPGWMDPSFSTAPWEGLTCLGRTNTNVWRSSAASRDGIVSSKCLYREDYKSDNSHLCFRLLSPSGTSISEVCTATASKVGLHSLQWNFTHWQVTSSGQKSKLDFNHSSGCASLSVAISFRRRLPLGFLGLGAFQRFSAQYVGTARVVSSGHWACTNCDLSHNCTVFFF